MVPLMTKLKDLILKAFDDDQFSMLMFEITQDFDYAGLPDKFEVKVFKTVKWAYQFGDAQKVLWLARIVAEKRPQRQDTQQLVADIRAFISAGAVPPPPGAGANGATIPQELSSALSLFEQKNFTIGDLLRDVRPKLRAPLYQQYDLPGRYHLSDSDGIVCWPCSHSRPCPMRPICAGCRSECWGRSCWWDLQPLRV